MSDANQGCHYRIPFERFGRRTAENRVTETAAQLAFDLGALPRRHDDELARIRANVTEPGMTDAEIEAAVADAIEQFRPATNGSARPCVCEHPSVFAEEFGGSRCGLCGKGRRR
jgi:hypothetical protein